MPILPSRDHFYVMSKAFVAAESQRLAEVVKEMLAEHYPGESLELKASDHDGPQSDTDRPGPPMLRLAYHGLISEDLQFRDDGNDFARLQGLYQFSVLVHMMLVKEDRDAQSISELLSRHGQKAAHARHAENREIADSIKAWYRKHHTDYRSMDAAAEAVIKLQPIRFRTARKHISAAAKEFGLSKRKVR